MSTYVMKFGVRGIIEHAAEAQTEMREAHRYYNALLESRITADRSYRALRARCVPELAAAESEIARLSEEIERVYVGLREVRQAARSKLDLTDEQRATLDRLKTERDSAYGVAKKLRPKFELLIRPDRQAFDARTSGAEPELIAQIGEIGRQLAAAKKQPNNPDVGMLSRTLSALKARKKSGAPSTHKKSAVNLSVAEDMMDDPSVSGAWKEARQIEAEQHEKMIELRGASGLAAGTYTAVEHAVDQAFETSFGEPRFRRWDGGRKIGIQVATGKSPLTGARLYAGTDSRLQIVSRESPRGRRDPLLRVERSPNSARSHHEYAIVRMPVGKGDAKRFLSIEVLLHRCIPNDAVITWAYLVPRSRGDSVKYTLQLTMNTNGPLVQREYGDGECAVRLRWSRDRSVDTEKSQRGIVVAEIDGEEFAMDGAAYQANASRFGVRGGAYAGMMWARLHRSFADQHFDGPKDGPLRGAKQRLHDWMINNPSLVPGWLTEMTSLKVATDTERGHGSLLQWRDHERLINLARMWVAEMPWASLAPITSERCRTRLQEVWVAWKQHRKANGQDLYAVPSEVAVWLATQGNFSEFDCMGVWLEWWRRKDQHLVTVARNVDEKARGNRKQQYRNKAAELARRFASVVVYEHDLAKSAKRKKAGEDADELNQQARYQRVCAAPSEFKEALKLAFGAERYREMKRERSGDAPDLVGARKLSDREENGVVLVEEHAAAE